MTFKDAMNSASAGNAVKRPSMRGYIIKDQTGLSEEEIQEKKYRLVVVEGDGRRTVFPMNGLEPEKTDGKAVEAKLQVNAGFIEGMLATDWVEASADDYEAARAGAGRW